MADLEQLNVRLTASTGDAHRAIDKLISDFGRLNTALNNFSAGSTYVVGLNNLVGGLERLGVAVSSINPEQIKSISSALGSLAKNGDKLAQLSGRTFLSGVANESQKIAVASEQARKKAEELAASYNFDMKGEGVSKLANAIDRLQASTGNVQAIRDAKQEIESIITTYARYENELHEVAKAENELIRNSHKKLNSDWAGQFGDAESARIARGRLGIATSSKAGGSADSIISENASLGMQTVANESDNLGLALQRLNDNARNAQNEFVGFNDVSVTVSGGIQQVRSDIDALCSSLGIATERMREMTSATTAAENDGFMDYSQISLNDEPWMQGDTASRVEQIASAEEHAATAGAQMASSIQQIGQSGTLFAPIAEGLQQISNITFGDMTPLLQLKDVISKIGGTSGQNAAASLPLIAQGIRSLDVKVPAIGAELDALAVGLRALGSPNIERAAQALPFVADGLRMLQGIKVTADIEAISQLAFAVSRFGLANIEKSIANMPVLAEALKSLIASLSSLPPVSDNTVALLNALGGLNVNASNAMRSMYGMGRSLRSYTGAVRTAHRHSVSFASIAGKIYANFFLLFRLFRRVRQILGLASDLKEVQNVVDVTFGDMSEKMNEFAKTAVDTLGMSELTAKKIGSRYQAMGSAMNISPKMIKDASEFVNVATKGYAEVSDSMADMSLNLTKLSGDMASFYNLDYEDVAEKMNAIFTGQTRPLRTFGLDLTQATLQEWALANGMDIDIKKMSQAEKTMIRYQYVLANTTAAQGDFQRTIMTWANQTRIAKERLKQLGVVLGKIGVYTFKPLVVNFNKAMNTMIDLATSTLNSLGKIFGWQIEYTGAGILQDEADGLEDVADGYDDASKAAKKFQNFLLGIDELNLLPDDKGDKGSGADDIEDMYGNLGATAGDFDIKQTEGMFDSLYDTLYKLGKRIGEVQKEWLQGIDWDKIFQKVRKFGENIADFLNGYLSDSELFYEKGKYIANGINTIANAIDGFFKRFNGWQLGIDIGSYINGFTNNLDWNVIQSAATEMAHDIAQIINGAFIKTDWGMVGHTIAEGLNTVVDYFYTLGDEISWNVVGSSIAEGINSAFRDFDFGQLASTLNKWAKGMLNALITVLKRTDWKMIGRKIGEFISGIDIMSIASKIGGVIWEAINASVKLWYGMFDSAPIETALITALALPFSNRVFRMHFSTLIYQFSGWIGSSLLHDFAGVFNGRLMNAFIGGFMDMNVSGLWSNVASGFNAVSAKLSPVTKAIGGVAAIAGEFIAVKDAMYECVRGTGDIADGIKQLAVAVGIATPALALLFGVPAGLLIAGAGAAAGAIVGIVNALNKIEEDNVLSKLAKDMGDTYHTLGDINQAFSNIANDITDGLDKMSRTHDQLEGLRSDLSDMVGRFSIIGEAASNSNRLTSDALSELVVNIGEVKQAWEDYIKAQYDYLIQSTINNMNFIKSQRDLTDEEVAYFTNKINTLTNAKYRDIEKSQQLAEEADKAWNAYLKAANGGGVPSTVLDMLYDKAVNATNALYGLAESTGVITDERIKEVNNSILTLDEVTGKIHFPDLDTSSYETSMEEMKGYAEEFADTYKVAYDKIASYQRELEASGISHEDVVKETQEMFDTLDRSAKNALDSVQLSLYDKLYKFIGKNDYEGAWDFYNNVMVPYTDMIKEQYGEATDGLEPWLQERSKELIASSFDVSYSKNEVTGNTHLHSTLKDGWVDMFWKLRDEVVPDAEKIGEDMGTAVNNGFLTTAGADSIIDDIEIVGKTSSNSFGQIERSMKPAITRAGLLSDSVMKMRNEFGKAALKSNEMKGSFDTLSTTFDTVKDKINKSRSFEGVKKSTDDVVGGLDNIKGKTETTASILQTNLSAMGGYIKTAFEGITSTKNVFVQGFQEDFMKLFSTQTWETMITGVPNAFRTMWDNTLKVMKTMWAEFAKWVNQNAVIEIPKTKIGKAEFGGTNVKLSIPRYETGGFPEDGFFYANHTEMVGSFANGKTAVANNEQITEGIERAVYRAMTDAMAQNGGNVNVELHGDAASLFTAVVKENNNHIMRTGYSPIRN